MDKVKVDPEDHRGKKRDASYTPKWTLTFMTAFWGIIFTGLTLGLYIFWVKTDLRRQYWSNFRVLGKGMEYRGMAPEALFVYLVFGLAIANYIFAVYTYTRSFGVADFDFGPRIGSIPAFYVLLAPLVILLPYIAFRAKRYFVHQIYWQDIRFRMGRGALAYFGRAMAWYAAQLATLGLVKPLADYSQRRFLTKRVTYGGLKFRLGGSALELYKSFAVLWICLIALLAIIGLSSNAAPRSLGGLTLAPDGSWVGIDAAPSLVTPALVAGLIALGVAYVWYSSCREAYFIRHTTLGESGLRNGLTGMTVFWMRMQALLGVAVFSAIGIGVIYMLLLIAERALGPVALAEEPLGQLITYAIVGWGAVLLGAVSFATYHVVYQARLMSCVAAGMKITNPDVLKAVKDVKPQPANDTSRLGRAITGAAKAVTRKKDA